MNILNFCLINLDIIGICPIRKDKRPRIVFYVVSVYLMGFLALAKLYYEKINLKLISDVLQTTFIVIHVSSKVSIVHFKRDNIRQFVDMMDKFWDYRKSSDNVEREISMILIFLKKIQRIMLIAACITISAYACRPLISHILPLVCYVPSVIPFYPFALFNGLIFFIAGWIVINYDMLTCSSLILVYCQFKILNDKIKKMNHVIRNDSDLKRFQAEIKIIVDHHNFLKEVISRFNKIFNMPILIQYFLTVVSMCFEFLRFTKSSNGIFEMIICLLSVLCLVLQLVASLSYPAMLVIDEASKISLSVYCSNWISCDNISIRRQLLTLATSTAIEIRITAGYLFSVDLQSCTKVLKAAFSFFTFMNTLVATSYITNNK